LPDAGAAADPEPAPAASAAEPAAEPEPAAPGWGPGWALFDPTALDAAAALSACCTVGAGTAEVSLVWAGCGVVCGAGWAPAGDDPNTASAPDARTAAASAPIAVTATARDRSW